MYDDLPVTPLIRRLQVVERLLGAALFLGLAIVSALILAGY